MKLAARYLRRLASLRAPATWLLACASLAAVSCSIDATDACDAHQVYVKGGTAINYAVCACDEAQGYVFDVQAGHGCKHCASGQTIVAGKCVTPAPDASVDEADAGAAPVHQVTGVGEPCASDTDCASFDAKFCAPLQNTCFIDKCATHENQCPSDSACCDYSALLAGLSLCVPNSQLDHGNCAMGGKKVTP